MKTGKWWALGSGMVIVVVLIISAITIFWRDSKSKFESRRAEKEFLTSTARVAGYPYVSLHTFPNGINQITIPIGPERWEGVALPLDAIAYDVDATVWRQIRSWESKDGPILKKGQYAYIPIQRNSNISEATFWIRGEGESTITINR